MLTLHTTPVSANGRKALAVAHHLQIPLHVVLVDVYKGEGRRPEYLAINPSGKIPTLVDGDLVLSESNAIAVYLAEAHGGDRLWSRDPATRARILRWMFWEASAWQPALAATMAGRAAQLLGLTPSEPAVVTDWTGPAFTAVARLLEEQLTGRSFLVGDEPSLADWSVAAMMTYARATAFPFGAWPAIGAWLARIEALDAWRATAADPWRT